MSFHPLSHRIVINPPPGIGKDKPNLITDETMSDGIDRMVKGIDDILNEIWQNNYSPELGENFESMFKGAFASVLVDTLKKRYAF